MYLGILSTDSSSQFILKKYLLLILFLDKAKLTRLIDYDPCLFQVNSSVKVLLMLIIVASIIYYNYLLASERSERDTYRGKNEKIGDVCVFVYMDVRMSFCTLTLLFLCSLRVRPRPKLH